MVPGLVFPRRRATQPVGVSDTTLGGLASGYGGMRPFSAQSRGVRSCR